jgi:hypothetical protein
MLKPLLPVSGFLYDGPMTNTEGTRITSYTDNLEELLSTLSTQGLTEFITVDVFRSVLRDISEQAKFDPIRYELVKVSYSRDSQIWVDLVFRNSFEAHRFFLETDPHYDVVRFVENYPMNRRLTMMWSQ